MDQNLTNVLPRPEVIGSVCSVGEWANLESEIGTNVPLDIKEFNRYYGAGCLGSYVITPLLPTTDGIFSLIKSNEVAGPLVREYVDSGDLRPSVSVFPEPGGLLEWADSGNGHMWFWVTDGEPDDWKVAAIPHGYPLPIYYYDLSATGYLSQLLSGDLHDEFSLGMAYLSPPLKQYETATLRS